MMSWRALWKRLVAFCYQREAQYIYYMDVERTFQLAPPLVEGLTEVVCDAGNLKQVKEVIKPFPDVTERYIKKGDIAFLAAQGSEWVFRSNAVMGPSIYKLIGFPLKLCQQDAFLECAETTACWRGKGVAPGMLRITMRTLLDRGIKRAFLGIATTNTFSCRAVEKGGAQRIGIISSCRVLGRRKSALTLLTDDQQFNSFSAYMQPLVRDLIHL